MSTAPQGFISRHLSAGDRLAEVLCGLVMVLTFTLGAGLTVDDGPDAALALLYAAIGCNAAWGIIDGVLYVLTAMSGRSARVVFVRRVQGAADEAAALAVVRAEVDGRIAALATPAARDTLARDMLGHLRSPAGAAEAVADARAGRVTADDLLGACAIGALELLVCIPAALPFLLLRHDRLLALRASNLVLVAMLFIVGWKWAGHAQLNRWLTGLLLAGLGIVLVVVAILLGG